MFRCRAAVAPLHIADRHRCYGLLLALLVVPGSSLFAAPTPAWTTHSPGGTVDAGFYASCGSEPVMLDGQGNAILVRIFSSSGSGMFNTPFLSIAKFAPTGQLLWRVDDLAPPQTHFFSANDPCAAALDTAGNVVVASSGPVFHAFGFRSLVTVRYAATDGARLWMAETDSIYPQVVRGVAVDAQGDVWTMASGGRPPPLSGTRTLIVKYRGDTGALAWPSRTDGEILGLTNYSMLALDAQGDAIVASTSSAAKLAGASGDTVWTTSVPSSTILGAYFVRGGLVVDGAGDVLLVKGDVAAQLEIRPSFFQDMRDYATVKLSGATGVPLWTTPSQNVSRYDGPAQRDDMPESIVLDASGNAIVHGRSQAGGQELQHFDFATLKLDGATGAAAWSGLAAGAARYNGPGNHRDVGTDAAVDAAGDVYVTGLTTTATGDEDILTRKYSGVTGAPLWSGLPDFAARHDGPGGGFDAGEGVAIGIGGDAVVVGREANQENDDQVVLRLDGANGTPHWIARSEPAVLRAERIRDLQTRTTAVDALGNTYIAGTTFNGACDVWLLMKVAPDGTRLWTQRFAPVRATSRVTCGTALALALDTDGDAFVTGELDGRIATAKFAGADGEPLWTGLPDGIAVHEPAPYIAGRLIAVDRQGDVVVVAGTRLYTSNELRYFYTIKYDGETGSPIWVGQHEQGPYFYRPNAVLLPTGLAIDAQDHVFVTAFAPDSQTHEGVVTVKYDGASGLPLWSGLPDGTATFACFMPVLALDPAQDPIVACSVANGSQGRDFATIKYSGATGQTRWTQHTDGAARYSGPGNGDDYVHAIAVDHRGDIYVAGDSPGVDGATDWATVKYSGVDGTTRWPEGALREDRPGFAFASFWLSLEDNDAILLAAQPSSTVAIPPAGAWSLRDARTGALLHSQSVPAGTTVRGAVLAADGDLRLAGSADDVGTSTAYVSRIVGLELPLLRSGFEDGE